MKKKTLVMFSLLVTLPESKPVLLTSCLRHLTSEGEKEGKHFTKHFHVGDVIGRKNKSRKRGNGDDEEEQDEKNWGLGWGGVGGAGRGGIYF